MFKLILRTLILSGALITILACTAETQITKPEQAKPAQLEVTTDKASQWNKRTFQTYAVKLIDKDRAAICANEAIERGLTLIGITGQTGSVTRYVVFVRGLELECGAWANWCVTDMNGSW